MPKQEYSGTSSPRVAGPRGPGLLEPLLLCAVVALAAWFYLWTATAVTRPALGTDLAGYYNLQAGGFLKGHTALDKEADPFLATLSNPWDPAQRGGHGLHDASYYQGHYHMYFGASPAVMLFLPLRLLTGYSIAEHAAVVLFAVIGATFAVTLLAMVRRRYFPALSTFWLLVCALVLVGGTMVPVLMRRPSIWEVPITAAYACLMFALLAGYQAVHRIRSLVWIALASTALGLAVGARPVYLFSCAGLLIPVWWVWRRRGVGLGGLLAAALLPAGAIGLGLALFNYARFGSIAEFGQKYQMAGDDVTKLQFFSWAYPLYGVRLYLLEAAGWSPYFPFVTVITAPPAPPGHLGVENPYGVLPNMPFVWCLGGLLLLRRAGTDRLRVTVRMTLTCGLIAMLTVMSFGGITNRYQVDFVPALMLAAALGALGALSWTGGSRWLRGAIRVGVVGLAAFTLLFNVLVSLQHNELLRVESPETYRRLAYRANHLGLAWDRLMGTDYGPLELKVTFPEGKAGTLQCFLATGTAFRADYLYLHYIDQRTLQFGFEHTSHGGTTSEPFSYEPGRTYTVRVDMGSLYPPVDHPYYDDMPKPQARALRRTLKVAVDDQVLLHENADFYDATSPVPTLGSSGPRPGFRASFSGRIQSWRRVPELLPVAPRPAYGPLRMTVQFPDFAGARNEPLLSSGETGRGDVIYVRYVSPTQVAFGHDNWGGGGRESPPIEMDPSGTHTIEIDFGPLYPSGTEVAWPHPRTTDRLVIRFNGTVALEQPVPFHPAEPDTVLPGVNAIHASSASAAFTGVIHAVERPLDPAP